MLTWWLPGCNDKSKLYFRTIYVAEFANDRLLGYQRQPNNDLTQIWVIL